MECHHNPDYQLFDKIRGNKVTLLFLPALSNTGSNRIMYEWMVQDHDYFYVTLVYKQCVSKGPGHDEFNNSFCGLVIAVEDFCCIRKIMQNDVIRNLSKDTCRIIMNTMEAVRRFRFIIDEYHTRFPIFAISHESATQYYSDNVSVDKIYKFAFDSRRVQQHYFPHHHNMFVLQNIPSLECTKHGDKHQIRRKAIVEGVVIILVGSVYKRKAQLDFCKNVFIPLRQKGYNIRVEIIGDIVSDHETWEQLCKTYPISMRGHQKDVKPFLRQSDILISASLNESFPLNVMEAMTLGIPVVVTDAFGTVDLVRDGVDGFVIRMPKPLYNFDAGETPFHDPTFVSTFQTRLVQICSDDALRYAMGNNAKQRIEDDFNYNGFLLSHRIFFSPQQFIPSLETLPTIGPGNDIKSMLSAFRFFEYFYVQDDDGRKLMNKQYTNFLPSAHNYPVKNFRTWRILCNDVEDAHVRHIVAPFPLTQEEKSVLRQDWPSAKFGNTSIDNVYEEIPETVRQTILHDIRRFPFDPVYTELAKNVFGNASRATSLALSLRTWSSDRYTEVSLGRTYHKARYDELLNHVLSLGTMETIFISCDQDAALNNFVQGIDSKYNIVRIDNAPEIKGMSLTESSYVKMRIMSFCGYLIGDKISTFVELVWWFSECQQKLFFV